MATVTELHNPSFALFPVNNDRTAWRPIGLPMILVEPDRRDGLGNPIEASNVQQVRIVIEDVPRKTRVAGHDHTGLLVPDMELYARTLTTTELYDRQIDVRAQVFFRIDGTEITWEEAGLGDFMQYTTTTGVRDTITFLPSANYYDLSDLMIETEELRPDYYYLSYQSTFYKRITSGTELDELNCIDSTTLATSVYRFKINHPGQVIEESTRLTPAPYLTDDKKSEDSTVALYRPVADVMQDIFDEQWLLENLNWVDHITPEFVPYLAYLLGLDIPFFPQSLDKLRRTMMRNVVRLQQLKGSRRAIIDLFNLFGYTIFLINLYWSKDGKRTIRPGESLPDQLADQEIGIDAVCQIEPALAGYDTDGFGQLQIPLLHRPTEVATEQGIASVIESGDVILDAYLVRKGSEAHTELEAMTEAMNMDPSGYGESVGCVLPDVTGEGIEGYSQILIEGQIGLATEEILEGRQPPFTKSGVSLERLQNILNLTFNGAILFQEPNLFVATRSDGLALYAFVTYERQEYDVPEDLKDLQSNRFDLQLITRDGTQVTSDVLDFLVDYLFKIKAFHSLLNVIIMSIDAAEDYNVTDFCIGGESAQRYDTDAGRLQVPPPIIPSVPEEGDCDLGPESLGYKPEDIRLRDLKLKLLEEEHASWKSLDDRAGDDPGGDTHVERITDNASQEECKFNYRGQDRKLVQDRVEQSEIEEGPGPNANSLSVHNISNLDESPIDEADNGEFDPYGPDASSRTNQPGYGSFTREYTERPDSWCTPDGVTDYCYKGRVDDEVLHQSALSYNEQYHNHPCSVGMGTGVYYSYAVTLSQDHLDSAQGDALTQPYDEALQPKYNNFLGRLLWAYDNPPDETLHYTDRQYLDANVLDQRNYLALQKPELNIDIPYMHFPGTRFATLGNLESDFTHPVWNAKPWDAEYSTICGPEGNPCTTEPTYLNYYFEIDTNGDEVLMFDTEPHIIRGNGLSADIPNLGDHILETGAAFSDDDVIHSVYMAEADGHPAVTLDHVRSCDITGTEEEASEGTLQDGGLILVDSPLFSSAGECATGGHLDFCDGYAASYGYQDLGELDFDRGGMYTDLFDAMDIPFNMSGTSDQVLFFLISGIREDQGLRLSCGCTVVECDGTDATQFTNPRETLILECSADHYLNEDGQYEFGADHLESSTTLVADPEIGVHCDQLDGQIPTMFELL